MGKRILVTGSRHWTNKRVLRRALFDTWHEFGKAEDIVLVQGECHLGGADAMAKYIWEAMGFKVESHPAEWRNGKLLGPERNKKMVDLGADVCLAFPLASSRGTRNCMRLAEEAGIEVRVFEDIQLDWEYNPA